MAICCWNSLIVAQRMGKGWTFNVQGPPRPASEPPPRLWLLDCGVPFPKEMERFCITFPHHRSLFHRCRAVQCLLICAVDSCKKKGFKMHYNALGRARQAEELNLQADRGWIRVRINVYMKTFD